MFHLLANSVKEFPRRFIRTARRARKLRRLSWKVLCSSLSNIMFDPAPAPSRLLLHAAPAQGVFVDTNALKVSNQHRTFARVLFDPPIEDLRDKRSTYVKIFMNDFSRKVASAASEFLCAVDASEAELSFTGVCKKAVCCCCLGGSATGSGGVRELSGTLPVGHGGDGSGIRGERIADRAGVASGAMIRLLPRKESADGQTQQLSSWFLEYHVQEHWFKILLAADKSLAWGQNETGEIVVVEKWSDEAIKFRGEEVVEEGV